MKRLFVVLIVLLGIAIISYGSYCTKKEKVLLAAKLIGFEVEEIPESTENKKTVNTSLKKLGVVTYIKPKTNEFAALGHSLINRKEGTYIEGKCYEVEIETSYADLESSRNLGNIYLNQEKPIGHVYFDNFSGVYGTIENVNKKEYQEVETANRYEIKTGPANILIRLDGNSLESYEVEILAINYMASNKNIRIKITDERLINETGGIVQGMSGTPVMQNGKLIGAINSVSIDNPTDAYAIFIEKLI